MFAKKITYSTIALAIAGLSGNALSHGLIVDPPSRNALCGMIEKPDQATSPACQQAFQNDFNGGYQFMSVLTHDIGRQGGTSNNVCGFDSETLMAVQPRGMPQ